MKTLLIILFTVMPLVASETKTPVQEPPIPMEMAPVSFEDDVSDTWAKIRSLIAGSKREEYWKGIHGAIARHDPEAAQKALDGLIKDFPEVLKQSPFPVKFQQGSIAFWRKDFRQAYTELDRVVKALEQKYPNGIPPGKYAENNKSFMSDAYFGRGAAQMQLRNYAEAVEDFGKAFSLAANPFLPLNKCRALLKLRKYQAAAEEFDMAYRLNPLVTEKAEDNDYLCNVLVKKGFHPKPCANSDPKPGK